MTRRHFIVCVIIIFTMVISAPNNINANSTGDAALIGAGIPIVSAMIWLIIWAITGHNLLGDRVPQKNNNIEHIDPNPNIKDNNIIVQ